MLIFLPLLNAKASGLTEGSLFFTVQQLAGGDDIMNIGCGGIDAVNQAQRVIEINAHLRMPLPSRNITSSCCAIAAFTISEIPFKEVMQDFVNSL